MPARKDSLYEQIAKGLADAITDIRQKVVEEPWFGRVVNDRHVSVTEWPQAREVQPEQREQGQDRDADKGIDR